IVVQEWWGLTAHIRTIADRLAQQGYVAIIPDLYHGQVADDAERAHILARGLEPERALADLDAAAAWLRPQPRVGTAAPIGVIGFCMGGGYALQFGLHTSQKLGAIVMFYGTPVSDPQLLSSLKCPLMAHFGARDDGIPRDHVEAFEAALRKAGKKADVFV